VSGLVVLAASALASCLIPDVNLDGRPCPCASGYACDVPHNVCVRALSDGGRPPPDGPRPDAGPLADGSVPCDCWTQLATSPSTIGLRSVGFDQAGNVYFAGRADGDVEVLGESFDVSGETVAFVASAGGDGNRRWAHGYSSDGFVDFSDMDVDAGGTTAVVGSQWGIATYGTIELDAGVRQDGLVVGLDAMGTVLGAITVPGDTQNAQIRTVALHENLLAVAGQYAGDLDLGDGPLTPVTAAGEHGFAAVYDNDAVALVWSQAFVPGPMGEVYGNGAALGDSGSCFAIRFDSPTDFGGGTATARAQDGAVAWYSPTGAWIGQALISSDGLDRGARAELMPDGTCVAIGGVSGTFSAGSTDVPGFGGLDGWVARFDRDGGSVFAHALGGTGEDFASSVAVGPAGEIYVSGVFEGSAEIGGRSLESLGGTDGFVAAFESSGELRWAASFGGTGADSISDVAVSADGSRLAISGCFEGSIALGPVVSAPPGQNACFVHVFSASDPRLVGP
jgi:hypothetical protein